MLVKSCAPYYSTTEGQIHTDGIMKLDEHYVATVVKYRSIITLMQDFFVEMANNNMKDKDTKLPHVKLRCLLQETGFLPSTEFT